MNEIIQYVLTQSVFGAGFFWLISEVMKTNAIREAKYQETISDLTDKLGDLTVIKDDVKEIRNKIFK